MTIGEWIAHTRTSMTAREPLYQRGQRISNAVYARIRENPKFQQLVTQRSRFAWLLSAIVLILFYGLVLIVAFKPAIIGERIADGSSLTVGVAAGLFMFIFFWLLTALYVRSANTAFDALTIELIKDATKETK